MTTIEVEIPKKLEKSFQAGKQRMSYKAFLKKVEEIEEEKWVDVTFEEPIPMEEFSQYLKKQIHG